MVCLQRTDILLWSICPVYTQNDHIDVMTVVFLNLPIFAMKLWLSIWVGSSAASVFAENVTTVLDQLLEGYDNRIRPGFGGSPVIVAVNLNIRSMGPISESDMRMSMQCYLRQSWIDERLTFNIPGNETVRLALNIKMLEKIWHPDTVILNGQHSYLHTVPMPNKLFRIDPNGTILFSQRLTIQTRCMMRLAKFPLDSQDCPMNIGSFGYSDGDILYRWKYGNAKAVEIAKDMTLSQFDLISYLGSNKSSKFREALHSVLEINFHLKRRMGYFLIQVYLPCCLLVVLSWVSFWINREATADRIMLGVTTVLTMTFFGLDNRTDLPKVSYSTALDVYIASCFSFVMATVMQFAIVHYFTKLGSGEHDAMSNDDDSEDEILEKKDDRGFSTQRVANGRFRLSEYGFPETGNSHFLSSSYHGLWDCITRKEEGRRRFQSGFFTRLASGDPSQRAVNMSGMNSVSRIDKASRIMFPLAFAAFNIAYWAYYIL